MNYRSNPYYRLNPEPEPSVVVALKQHRLKAGQQFLAAAQAAGFNCGWADEDMSTNIIECDIHLNQSISVKALAEGSAWGRAMAQHPAPGQIIVCCEWNGEIRATLDFNAVESVTFAGE